MTDTEKALQAVADLADQVGQARAAEAELLRKLRQAIVAADRADAGRNEIVRHAAKGLSRPKVFETLGVADLRADIDTALKTLREPLESCYWLEEKGGRIRLGLEDPELDAQDPNTLPDDASAEGYDRASRSSAHWVDAANLAGQIRHLLRATGLTFAEIESQNLLASGGMCEVIRLTGD